MKKKLVNDLQSSSQKESQDTRGTRTEENREVDLRVVIRMPAVVKGKSVNHANRMNSRRQELTSKRNSMETAWNHSLQWNHNPELRKLHLEIK